MFYFTVVLMTEKLKLFKFDFTKTI